jgi:transcriptional regulator with XRE-family HTH domain
MEHPIGERLRAFRVMTCTPWSEIVKATGILERTLSKWERGTKPKKAGYEKLSAFLEEQEWNARRRLRLDHPGSSYLYAWPVWETGTIIMVKNEPQLVVEAATSALWQPADGGIYMKDDSLEPGIKKGAFLVIRRLKRKDILWGKRLYFIIDNNYNTYLGFYSCPSSNDSAIELSFDNKDYPSIYIEMNKIKYVFLVTNCIQKIN